MLQSQMVSWGYCIYAPRMLVAQALQLSITPCACSAEHRLQVPLRCSRGPTAPPREKRKQSLLGTGTDQRGREKGVSGSRVRGSCPRRRGFRRASPRAAGRGGALRSAALSPPQQARCLPWPHLRYGLPAPRGHSRDAGASAGVAEPGVRLLCAAGRLVPGAGAMRRAARAPAAAARPRPAGGAALRGPGAALRPGPAAAHEQRTLPARGRRGARRAPDPLRCAGGFARAGGSRRVGRFVRALSPVAAPVRTLRGAHPPAGLGRPCLLPGGALCQPSGRLRVRPAALSAARAGHFPGPGSAALVQTQGGAPRAARRLKALDHLQ